MRRPEVKLLLYLVLIQAWSNADYMEKVALLGYLAVSPFPQVAKGPGYTLRNWELTRAWPLLAAAAR